MSSANAATLTLCPHPNRVHFSIVSLSLSLPIVCGGTSVWSASNLSRHRYFKLAFDKVAALLHSISSIAETRNGLRRRILLRSFEHTDKA